jgi:hypothetical protein
MAASQLGSYAATQLGRYRLIDIGQHLGARQVTGLCGLCYMWPFCFYLIFSLQGRALVIRHRLCISIRPPASPSHTPLPCYHLSTHTHTHADRHSNSKTRSAQLLDLDAAPERKAFPPMAGQGPRSEETDPRPRTSALPLIHLHNSYSTWLLLLISCRRTCCRCRCRCRCRCAAAAAAAAAAAFIIGRERQ